MRTITNDYQDAKLWNLGGAATRGPFLVTQPGVAPGDATMRERSFVLMPGGKWVDLMSLLAAGPPHSDKALFKTSAQVLQLYATLPQHPEVEEREVDPQALTAWLERNQGIDQVQAVQRFVDGYRQRQAGSSGI
ncbi:hypothetical protein AYO41_00915 [Verrucomicrobia bacterium SCGC AG-212-E04]|nr:hypothetical protein AYO41_00915 [Verrucomicrobia bacterium SCGC AG-212-E04]